MVGSRKPSSSFLLPCLNVKSIIVKATGIKTGGSLTKLLDNLKESGITREYPRYGKGRVETVYQLKDFFSLFYLRFVQGKQVKPGGWTAIHGTASFYTWAGDTFELLSIEHLQNMQSALRLPSIDRNYCWSGKDVEGKGAQIDLVLESKAAQTDYLCEMKFSSAKFMVTHDVEENIRHKIDAFANSKMHNKTRSIQTVLVTTMGLASNMHASIINHTISLDELFM